MTMNTIRTGDTEQLQVYATTASGAPLTGATDLYVRVWRKSDGFFLDWNDMTFKSAGWTTLNGLLTQVNATNLAGVYQRALATGSITNHVTDDEFVIYPLQTPGTNARLPSPGNLIVGQWRDQVDTTFDKLPDNNIMGSGVKTDKDDEIDAILADTNEMQGKLPTDYIMGSAVQTSKDDEIDAILADTNEMQGKLPTNNIMGSSVKTDKDDEIDAILADTAAMEPLVTAYVDATISSRESETDAASRAAADLAEHATTQAAVADVPNTVWDELLSGHFIAGSAGQALDRVDVDVSTRAVPGDAMDLVTDALDANALAADAVAEIADGVWDEAQADHLTAGTTGKSLSDAATGAAISPANIADAVWDEDMTAHNGAGTAGQYQRRVDALVSSRAVAGDAMDLIAGAVDSNALDVTAVAEIADGVWDEPRAGHLTAGSAGEAQNRLDATISSRAAPGAAMDLVTGAVDSDAIATSGAQEIADSVWDEPKAGHVGAGTTGEAIGRLDVAVSTRAAPGAAMTLTGPERGLVADAIWDEALAGHLTAGTTGKALQDAGATADPSVIADAVWDEAAAAHVAVGSMGQLQNRLDVAVSSRAVTGAAMTLAPNAVNAAALAADAVAEIADGVWDEAMAGHAGAGSAGQYQARLDANISTRAVPGDAMDLVTDAVDANALATDAVNEIADQVWEEQIADHSGTAGSVAEALDNVAAPASPAAIADAVWDEALAGHAGAGSAGEALGRVDVDVSTRATPGAAMDLVTDAVDANALATSAVTEIQSAILSDATPFPGARIDATISSRAAPGAAMDLVTDAVDAAAIANSGAAELADAVWDEPISGHLSAGSVGLELSQKTEGGEAMTLTAGERGAIADSIWDEPLAGHLGAGSTGEALDNAGATADPAAIADAVWDEDLSGHTTAGSAGQAQIDAATASSAAEKIDSAAVTWPPTPGSLLDVLANKDGGQTYDQATDSLEALRDRVG